MGIVAESSVSIIWSSMQDRTKHRPSEQTKTAPMPTIISRYRSTSVDTESLASVPQTMGAAGASSMAVEEPIAGHLETLPEEHSSRRLHSTDDLSIICFLSETTIDFELL